jgi:uracil-DNA glycosylase
MTLQMEASREGCNRLEALATEIAGCWLFLDRFVATAKRHMPRPIKWFGSGARVLVAGQAPGLRVHASGRPFDDPSGMRLRAWIDLTETEFRVCARVEVAQMAFCFPRYDVRGRDLPPPAICAATWRARGMDAFGPRRLTLRCGGAAIRWNLGRRDVTTAVSGWRRHTPDVFPLPHPSWRNGRWPKRNPWFAEGDR